MTQTNDTFFFTTTDTSKVPDTSHLLPNRIIAIRQNWTSEPNAFNYVFLYASGKPIPLKDAKKFASIFCKTNKNKEIPNIYVDYDTKTDTYCWKFIDNSDFTYDKVKYIVNTYNKTLN